MWPRYYKRVPLIKIVENFHTNIKYIVSVKILLNGTLPGDLEKFVSSLEGIKNVACILHIGYVLWKCIFFARMQNLLGIYNKKYVQLSCIKYFIKNMSDIGFIFLLFADFSSLTF